jgi:phospho-N-acetylmuramoyl-pentapeptide-transferase
MLEDIIKVMVPATLAFFVGIGITPVLSHYLFAFKAWKKSAGKKEYGGTGEASVFNELHKHKEVGTPRMGGVVMWASVFVVVTLIWALAHMFATETLIKLEFLSRNQTWIPFFALIVGSLVGLIDDIFEVRGTGKHFTGGLPLQHRLLAVSGAALFVGWWFYEKLEVYSVSLPFIGELWVGIFIIPLFVFTTVFLYAGGVIDGIDGLAGGVFACIFSAYAGIAFFQNQIDLAAFCATVVGGLLAFLWFNIPPARFYLSETGVMGLTMALAVIAFMTDTLGEGRGVFVLPIVAFPLVVTVFSDVIQIVSKRLRGKKIFRVAPIHHHFEAIGWPGPKVTMRYWVISVVCAFIGVIVAIA